MQATVKTSANTYTHLVIYQNFAISFSSPQLYTTLLRGLFKYEDCLRNDLSCV